MIVGGLDENLAPIARIVAPLDVYSAQPRDRKNGEDREGGGRSIRD